MSRATGCKIYSNDKETTLLLQGGYIFLLYGSPISWLSKVQCTIALSTTKAELMAGTEATREAIWIKGLTNVLFAMNLDNDKRGETTEGILKCELRGDNQGSLALLVNPVYHERKKHIDILADGLTKPLARDTHSDHCLRMGLRLYQDTPSINFAIHDTVGYDLKHFSYNIYRKVEITEWGKTSGGNHLTYLLQSLRCFIIGGSHSVGEVI